MFTPGSPGPSNCPAASRHQPVKGDGRHQGHDAAYGRQGTLSGSLNHDTLQFFHRKHGCFPGPSVVAEEENPLGGRNQQLARCRRVHPAGHLPVKTHGLPFPRGAGPRPAPGKDSFLLERPGQSRQSSVSRGGGGKDNVAAPFLNGLCSFLPRLTLSIGSFQVPACKGRLSRPCFAPKSSGVCYHCGQSIDQPFCVLKGG